jgi:hypothetical protein
MLPGFGIIGVHLVIYEERQISRCGVAIFSRSMRAMGAVAW